MMLFDLGNRRFVGRSLLGQVARSSAPGRGHGQALMEYALVISLMAMVALGGFSMAGGSLQATLSGISGTAAGVLQPNTTGPAATTTAVTSTVAQTTTSATTTSATTTTTKKKKSH